MWYTKSLGEIKRDLRTNFDYGLTEEEVTRRQEISGPNRLKEKKKESFFIKFIKQFNNVIIVMLTYNAFSEGELIMFKKQIIIRNLITNKAKVFELNQNQLEEAIDFIEYHDGVLENNTYVFCNPIRFQLIDLYLSTVSTPQPLLRGIA